MTHIFLHWVSVCPKCSVQKHHVIAHQMFWSFLRWHPKRFYDFCNQRKRRKRNFLNRKKVKRKNFHFPISSRFVGIRFFLFFFYGVYVLWVFPFVSEFFWYLLVVFKFSLVYKFIFLAIFSYIFLVGRNKCYRCVIWCFSIFYFLGNFSSFYVYLFSKFITFSFNFAD